MARVEMCDTTSSSTCEWVYDKTNSEALASIADWFVGVPLTILIIVVVAWLLRRLARRTIRRFAARMADTDGIVSLTPLSRLSRDRADAVTVSDPRRVSRAQSIGFVLSSTVTVLIWGIALILVIGELGINLAPLIAGAGIAGVALGFGTQSLVKDCVSGLFMIIEDQYGLGDIVDLGQATGVVEQITLRATVLRGQDGTVWHVPNGAVLRVGNLSQVWSVAVMDVLVSPDRPLDDVKAAALQAAAEVCARPELAPTVLEPTQMLGVESITADAITLRMLTKTKPGAQFVLQRAMQEAVKRRLDELDLAAAASEQESWSRVAATPPADADPDASPPS